MEECNPTKYSMLELLKDSKGNLVNSTEYRCVIRRLRYFTHTHLDLSYAIGIMSRCMKRPTMMHHQAIKHILRYVNGTTSYGLKYQRGKGPKELVSFTDSDLARDIYDRKCTGRFISTKI